MYIELLKAVLLGAIQGISEFLPISSTGHLIIAEYVLGISQETYGLAFDAALHLGSLVAILWFFRKEWIKIGNSIYRKIIGKNYDKKDEKLIWLLLIGTVPGVLIGLLFEDLVDSIFRSPLLVGFSLILFSGVLWYVEKMGKKHNTLESLTNKNAITIGIAQAVALIPGVSRSGITIAAGMFCELKRVEAARFAFLLSAPIVAGAGGKKMIDTYELFKSGVLGSNELLFFITGMVSAGIFGYFTIKLLLDFLSKHTLMPFIVYRIFLGFSILLVTLLF